MAQERAIGAGRPHKGNDMGYYRQVRCDFWEDPAFPKLTADETAVYLFLWTNMVVPVSGIYRKSLETLYSMFSQRVKVDFEAFVKAFEGLEGIGAIVFDRPTNMLWIRNFIRHQGTAESSKVRKGIVTHIALLKTQGHRFAEEFMREHGKELGVEKHDTLSDPIDTISIGYGKDMIQEGDGRCPGQKIIEKWNAYADTKNERKLIPVLRLTKTDAARLRTLWKNEMFRKNVMALIERCGKSAYCTGGSEIGWRATFGWFMRKWDKVLAGQYDKVYVFGSGPAAVEARKLAEARKAGERRRAAEEQEKAKRIEQERQRQKILAARVADEKSGKKPVSLSEEFRKMKQGGYHEAAK